MSVDNLERILIERILKLAEEIKATGDDELRNKLAFAMQEAAIRMKGNLKWKQEPELSK